MSIDHEMTIRTDSNDYNSGTKSFQLIHEEINAAQNWSIIMKMFEEGKAKDINDEPKANNAPCIIIGSGASLDLALPLLKDWKGGIICTTSHALSLVKFGAPPTHILALDPFCTMEEIEGIDWSEYKTKLITTPTVWPGLISGWPNEILLYRQNMGRKDSYYASTLCHMYSKRLKMTEAEIEELCRINGILKENFNYSRAYAFPPIIRTEVTMFACSPPAQLFVAQVMGYGNIFLSGCDFGFTYGKDRFTNWTVSRPKQKLVIIGNATSVVIQEQWKSHEHLVDPEQATVISANGILSHPSHLYYKKNMISAWRLSKQNIWTTDFGTITEMPYIPLDRVIAKQGIHLHELSNSEKVRRSEEYLAGVGAFIIETDSGLSFVESKNPEEEILAYMTGMNRLYKCSVCKTDLSASNDEDQTNSKCPKCGIGIMSPGARADIDKNMAKMRSRIKAAAKLSKV